MLLAIDVGNTHTVIGLYRADKLEHHWRLPTNKKTTPDQMSLVMKGLLKDGDLDIKDISGLCFCSVVPEVSYSLDAMSEKLGIKKLNLDAIKTRVIDINYDHPESIGSDRIANAVAVKKFFGTPAIVADFGTATTFDVVSKEGAYIGGSIAPGVETSINGLLERAAQLYDIRLETASKAIGKNTKDSISAGFIMGLAGLADHLISKTTDEIGEKPVVVATGGFSKLMKPYCEKIDEADIFLTLKGLKIIFDESRGN